MRKLTFFCWILLILSIVSESYAQERDWYDSLQDHHRIRQERLELQAARRASERLDSISYEIPAAIAFRILFSENPGFCGIEQKHVLNSYGRYELPFFDEGDRQMHPWMGFFAYDASFGKRKRFAYGSAWIHSRGGAFKKGEWNHSFSWRFTIRRNHLLRLGVSVSMFQIITDFNNRLFPDQISPNHGYTFFTRELKPGGLKILSVNFNAGVTYRRKNFMAGFSVANLTEPDEGLMSLSRIRRTYYIHSAHHFQVHPAVALDPFIELRFSGRQALLDCHLTAVFQNQLMTGLSLVGNSNAELTLGYTRKGWVCFTTHVAFAGSREMRQHFGSVLYVSSGLRFMLGIYQKQF